MNWRGLTEEIKAFGYTIEMDEIWNEYTGLIFIKEGVFYYWSAED